MTYDISWEETIFIILLFHELKRHSTYFSCFIINDRKKMIQKVYLMFKKCEGLIRSVYMTFFFMFCICNQFFATLYILSNNFIDLKKNINFMIQNSDLKMFDPIKNSFKIFFPYLFPELASMMFLFKTVLTIW